MFEKGDSTIKGKTHILLAVASFAMASACVSPGGQPAEFNIPAKAKLMKVSFVRAFTECPPEGLVCAPIPLSAYEFGPRGSCSAKASGKVVSPCPRGGYPNCYEIRFQVKCKDIRDQFGTPAEGTGWELRTTARLTVANGGMGGFTDVVDMTLQGTVVASFPAASNGQLRLKTTSSAFMDDEEFPAGAALPAEGTSGELLDLAIVDPDGNRFAAIGLGIAP